MLAIAFSLWRAAFLADKTGKRSKVFDHGREFLAKVIEDNAIAYVQDKTSREWTFNYYTGNARNSLEFLARYWQGFPGYVRATRKPAERWDYCQSLFEQAVDLFEQQIIAKRKAQAAKTAKFVRKQFAKKKRGMVRSLKKAGKIP